MKIRPKTIYITPVEAVEIGVALMRLKQVANHGEFLQRVEVLGYSGSEASRFIRLARKFNGVSNARLLEAVATVSKLNELVMLDDDEIEKLKTDGEIQGITLDDIKTLTVKELRASIRGIKLAREKLMDSIVEEKLGRHLRKSTCLVEQPTALENPAVPVVADMIADVDKLLLHFRKLSPKARAHVIQGTELLLASNSALGQG